MPILLVAPCQFQSPFKKKGEKVRRRHQCIIMGEQQSAAVHGVWGDTAGQWAVMAVGWAAV